MSTAKKAKKKIKPLEGVDLDLDVDDNAEDSLELDDDAVVVDDTSDEVAEVVVKVKEKVKPKVPASDTDYISEEEARELKRLEAHEARLAAGGSGEDDGDEDYEE